VLADAAVSERALGRDLLDAALGKQACWDSVRAAVPALLLDPLSTAAMLAAICWRAPGAAEEVARAHVGGALRAVRLASASLDPDAQQCILDAMHALLDRGGLREPALVTEVLRWMRSAAHHAPVRELGMSYVSACARVSLECARAASALYTHPLYIFACADDASVYLAGDIYSHDELVAEKEDELVLILQNISFDRYPAVYFASCMAQTARGRELVARHALSRLEAVAADEANELAAAAAQEAVEALRERMQDDEQAQRA
jgi:hypothetical protein